MPLSHQSLQSIRARFSEKGANASESSSGKSGIRNLRVGKPNHNVRNEPDSYEFDVSEVQSAYFRRYLRRKGTLLDEAAKITDTNRGP